MKLFAATLIIAAIAANAAKAQTFTQRLQKQAAGKGTVTVHHDKDIDKLVNGAWVERDAIERKRKEAEAKAAEGLKPKASPAKKPTAPHEGDKGDEAERAAVAEVTEAGQGSADTRKKVMLNSRKVNGYRVQAFAGGNTRQDRLKAEQVGNEIKQRFPEEPVYVHFYSPRWICRIGNYRSYEEAHQMLLEIQQLGYKQALIVKGKITVQY